MQIRTAPGSPYDLPQLCLQATRLPRAVHHCRRHGVRTNAADAAHARVHATGPEGRNPSLPGNCPGVRGRCAAGAMEYHGRLSYGPQRHRAHPHSCPSRPRQGHRCRSPHRPRRGLHGPLHGYRRPLGRARPGRPRGRRLRPQVPPGPHSARHSRLWKSYGRPHGPHRPGRLQRLRAQLAPCR